jgi:8-oxo-dGTP diphosphatase
MRSVLVCLALLNDASTVGGVRELREEGPALMSFEEYPKPAVAVDIVLLAWDGERVSLPLIRRGSDPFAGQWALPGGFLELDETLEQAARRELREETALEVETVVAGPVFDAVGRDPRGRVLSVPHLAFVRLGNLLARAGSDASDVRIFPLAGLPRPLAFDHEAVIPSLCAVAASALTEGGLARELADGERSSLARMLERYAARGAG